MPDIPQADVIHVNLDPGVVVAASAAHRRRFAEAVARLGADALAAPSRCSQWSNADVLRHLTDVDGWMLSMWAGEPPPFSSFNPNITPHEFVLAARDVPDLEVRDRYIASTQAMAADHEATGPERWGAPGVSPLGFVPWWLSALHIYWDSWLHERDVLLPLGIDIDYGDEFVPVLTYGLTMAATMNPEPVDVVIEGVRVVVGDGPIATTPQSSTSADTGVLVDALSGRSDITAAMAGYDDELIERFGQLGRFLAGV